jgi:hypothetical protein
LAEDFVFGYDSCDLISKRIISPSTERPDVIVETRYWKKDAKLCFFQMFENTKQIRSAEWILLIYSPDFNYHHFRLKDKLKVRFVGQS